MEEAEGREVQLDWAAGEVLWKREECRGEARSRSLGRPCVSSPRGIVGMACVLWRRERLTQSL